MTKTTPDPAFSLDVRRGLSSHPRSLPSKWFYDARGNELFQAIMASPEYYLTDCEDEIFRTAGPTLLAALGDRPFDLVELGAGDGSKTQRLIGQFLAAKAAFTYRPIDISAHALELLGKLITSRWPRLPFAPERGDYFEALGRLDRGPTGGPRLVLFPGGNIGNFTPEEAVSFLGRLRGLLRPGDWLLTGFDLKKDPAVVQAAYDDAGGHTAAFNLNLLARINRELGADFELGNWRHWETYNPVTGSAHSFLVARNACAVTIADHDETYAFEAAEAIDVEISQKYSRAEIKSLAEASGFTPVNNLEDGKGWFTDSLWRIEK